VTSRFLAACLSILLSACATTSASATRDQTLHDLTLARADGRTVPLSAYAGQPLLLFVFATYDEGSQVALAALTQYLERNPNVQVAGLAVQPEAQTFLALYKQAVKVPFELYYDPSSQVLQGTSGLGLLAGVPAFVSLDSGLHIRMIRYGIPTPADLDALTRPD
jgi:peroxiredoxin